MSRSNCCFLTWIQISQEAIQVGWYSHLLNFPQFVVIHTIEAFGIINKAEVDVFLELSCFFYDPTDAGNLISAFFYIQLERMKSIRLPDRLIIYPALLTIFPTIPRCYC